MTKPLSSMSRMPAFSSVDEYIAAAPEAAREVLVEIRRLFKTFVPDAVESISYGIPAYKLYGKVFLYFAAFPKHVSIYPRTKGIETGLEKEIAPYVSGKGTILFPLAAPVPFDLVERIIHVRLQEHNAKYG